MAASLSQSSATSAEPLPPPTAIPTVSTTKTTAATMVNNKNAATRAKSSLPLSAATATATTSLKAPPGVSPWTSFLRRFKRWMLRPSVWTALISVVAYWDDEALHGVYVYDDAGSIKKNLVVTGEVPWTQAFYRDFWGTPMRDIQSHKSFRPITTLSFRGNWIVSERLGTNATGTVGDHTYGFHLVNMILHGMVTGLATEASSFVFLDENANTNNFNDYNDDSNHGAMLAQLATGLLFGLHPVHAEAVSNMTSRGEILMSLFFLLAFLSFANHIPQTNHPQQQQEQYDSTRLRARIRSIVAIYIIPWICMTLSLFSKEQGATTLISLVVYDFIRNHGSLKDYLARILQYKTKAHAELAFLRRTLILAVQTLVVCLWRYWLNGETSPDFIYDQNPAGFSQDRFTRIFSVNWVYCLYIYDAVFPKYLCPDWSGISIDLITEWTDSRVEYVLVLWIFVAVCLVSLITGEPGDYRPPPPLLLPGSESNDSNIGNSSKIVESNSNNTGMPNDDGEMRRVILTAFFAFTFSPFLLSSNLLVVVGLMKADRVIYLPLLGFCLMEALLLKRLCYYVDDNYNEEAQEETELSKKRQNSAVLPRRPQFWCGYLLFLVQMGLFAAKLHERNLAWSDPLRLWMGAYSINKRSHHTIYNCGYELSLKGRYKEAELVLRPIADPHVDGPTNTFVYAMVLFNLNRCDEAHPFIDKAIRVIEQKRKSLDVRNTAKSLDRAESNLLVARAFCTPDLRIAGPVMYAAVEKDQTNEYAIQQAQAMIERVQRAKRLGLL